MIKNKRKTFNKKIIYNYFYYYIITLLILELYSFVDIGYFKEYQLHDNSIVEYMIISFLYSIFFIIQKGKKLIYTPILILIVYITIDFVSNAYNRYLDYSDLINIPLLFDALLQSQGQIVYLFFIIPLILMILFFISKTLRQYTFAIAIIILLFTISLPYINQPLLSPLIIKTYNKYAFSHKYFWTPNKLTFDYAKTGRLSTFFYEGMIKTINKNIIMKFAVGQKKELEKISNKLLPHIQKRNVYLVGLESFSLPKQLTSLKENYLNNDKNKTYDVVKKSSVMITSIFGGGTIQSEFEALCGEPALQKISAFEFTEFTGAPTNCLPQVLNSIGYSTLVSNTYKPQPSFEALTSVGFKEINFPKEYFPKLSSYLTNKNKAEGEYAIFDADLYKQNENYIKNKFISHNKPMFNYMFSVWGHALHEMTSKKRPLAIKLLNKNISLSEHTKLAINQEYYRINALQNYFDTIKQLDPNALIIAFSDHRPVLDGANSYKTYGLKTDVFHNFIVIMDKGKYIVYKKPFPLYALPDIILDRLTDGWYCKHNMCKLDTKDRDKYLTEYNKIMANAMNIDAKSSSFYMQPSKIYRYNDAFLPFKNFSQAESHFRWTNAKEAYINFMIKNKKDFSGLIELNIATFGKQKISIYLNDKQIYDNRLNTNGKTLKLQFSVNDLNDNKVNQLKFVLPDAHIPNKKDKRVLGMQFRYIKL